MVVSTINDKLGLVISEQKLSEGRGQFEVQK